MPHILGVKICILGPQTLSCTKNKKCQNIAVLHIQVAPIKDVVNAIP